MSEPTSHRYLYEMDRENLFTLFVGAVASLKVGDEGAYCRSAEAQGLERMARAVQRRTESRLPREAALAGLATVTRVLLSRTDGRAQDRADEEYWRGPIADVIAHFLRLRAEVGDFIPTAAPTPVPNDPSDALRDSTDQLDPDDEVSEGEDIPTVEGVYLWHTDGRPPEPVR